MAAVTIQGIARCNKCNEDKLLSEFSVRKESGKHRRECKKCMVEKSKTYYGKNKEKVKAYKKEYGKNNRSIISAKNKEYKGKPHIRERVNFLAREYTKNNKNKFIERRKKNRASRNEFMKKYNANMSKTKPEFKILNRLRSRIYSVLNGSVKTSSTIYLLGCSIDFFKKHFESLFTEGMSWEKYHEGEIHIDHITPCKNFDLKDPEQQKKCFHYTNLQPLWRLDNLKKGASMPNEFKTV